MVSRSTVLLTAAFGLLVPVVIVGVVLDSCLNDPDTSTVEGDLHRVDPLRQIEPARAFAGDGARLTRLSIQHVRADGTMDLEAPYRPTARYTFVRPVAAPADAPPTGTGSKVQWLESIEIEVTAPHLTHITTTGGSGSSEKDVWQKGMTRDRSSPSPTSEPPQELRTCPLAALWRAAIAKGAAPDAVADIDFDDRTIHFAIPGTSVTLHLTACP